LHKDLKPEDADTAIQDLLEIYDKLNIVTTRELAEKAVGIALTQGITVYDALYIAATQEIDATLYTADQKLHVTASKSTKSKLLKPS